MSKAKSSLSPVPRADFCVGRRLLCEQLITDVLDQRACLLFGARQSGKTTVLLAIKEKLDQELPTRRVLAVYINCQSMPVAPSLSAFLRHLLVGAWSQLPKGARKKSISQLRKASIEDIEKFENLLIKMGQAGRSHFSKIVFLCDEAKRFLSSEHHQTIANSLFSLLYGGGALNVGRCSFIFAGAQDLYKFFIDETSPIGSRAAKHLVSCLDLAAIKELTTVAVGARRLNGDLAEWVYEVSGGHAGVATSLLIEVAKTGGKCDRLAIESAVAKKKSEVFRIWDSSLTAGARCIEMALVGDRKISERDVVAELRANNIDPFEAGRSVEQLLFSGIASISPDTIAKRNKLYWAYLANHLQQVTSNSAPGQREGPVDLFISYSHRDEHYRERLGAHLKLLQRKGVIASWHDRKIMPGQQFDTEIDNNLQRARIVLLLVSASFLDSDYCYEIEMKQALKRHAEGTLVVVPVIIRPCDWHGAPFGKLNALPKDGRPIETRRSKDTAWTEVVIALRKIVNDLL